MEGLLGTDDTRVAGRPRIDGSAVRFTWPPEHYLVGQGRCVVVIEYQDTCTSLA